MKHLAAFLVLLFLAPLAQAAEARLTVDAANPKWDSGAAIAANVLPSLYVRLYGGLEGATPRLVDAAPWAPSLSFRRPDIAPGRVCYHALLAIDRTGDGLPDEEGPPSTPWCGTAEAPPLKLGPLNGITGEIVATVPTSGSALISWTPPTANSDGSALTNLAGFRIRYGKSATALDQTVQAPLTAASQSITPLTSGTWYFAVVAYTSSAVESALSNLASKTIL
jgi:hypothetical protein